MQNVIRVDFQKTIKLRGDERVLLRDVWKQLKLGKMFTHWASTQVKNFTENEDFGLIALEGRKSKGRPAQEYWVTVDTAKQIAMMSQTEEGKRVRKYFLECERLVYDAGLDTQLTDIPDILNTQFIRGLCDRLDQAEFRAETAEKQRLWIRTKAEATAMSTAARAVLEKKKVEAKVLHLQERLGEAEAYLTITAAKKKFSELRTIKASSLGQKIKKLSEALGRPVKKVVDVRYGEVNSYHVSAFEKYLLTNCRSPD